MVRHPGVDLGNLQKLLPPPGILLLCRKLCRVLGHAPGVDHHALGGVNDGFVEVNLLDIIGVLIIQLLQMFPGLPLDVQHALFHQDHVVAGVGIATAV